MAYFPTRDQTHATSSESRVLTTGPQDVVVVLSLSHVQLSCDFMDCSLPGSSVNGILQARILEWVANSFSRASSRPRDKIWVSFIAGISSITESPGKPCINIQGLYIHTHMYICVCVYDVLWEIGSYDDEVWEVPQSAFWKLRRASWCSSPSSSPSAKDQYPSWKTEQFLSYSIFCSIQASDRLDEIHSYWGGQSDSLSLSDKMLFCITFIQKYPCRPTQNNV